MGKRILRVVLLDYWYPAPKFGNFGMLHSHQSVDPGQARIEMDRFFGQPRTFGRIRITNRNKGQRFGVVILFGLFC